MAQTEFDIVIYQTKQQWDVEQYEILSASQRALPRIYIEHDPPLERPADAVHPMRDGDVLLVHVTPFNALMWHSPGVQTRVIEHGVVVSPEVRYTGEIASGIAAVNNIATRGRRIGLDVVEAVQRTAPVEVVGMGAELVGGPGEIPPLQLAEYEARYRFFLNPMRWTSLSMAVCEAMTIGMPILAPATNEMVTVVHNGVEGFIETDLEKLAAHAGRLIERPEEARALGENARKAALQRFAIERFVRDWDDALHLVAGRQRPNRPEEVIAR